MKVRKKFSIFAMFCFLLLIADTGFCSILSIIPVWKHTTVNFDFFKPQSVSVEKPKPVSSDFETSLDRQFRAYRFVSRSA